jgi:hypothetical protein
MSQLQVCGCVWFQVQTFLLIGDVFAERTACVVVSGSNLGICKAGTGGTVL